MAHTRETTIRLLIELIQCALDKLELQDIIRCNKIYKKSAKEAFITRESHLIKDPEYDWRVDPENLMYLVLNPKRILFLASSISHKDPNIVRKKYNEIDDPVISTLVFVNDVDFRHNTNFDEIEKQGNELLKRLGVNKSTIIKIPCNMKDVSELKAGERRYVGYVRQQTHFFNFYPKAEITSSGVRELSNEEVISLFPRYGAFCLLNGYKKEHLTRQLVDGYYYVIDLNDKQDFTANLGVNGELREDYHNVLADFEKLRKEGRFMPIHEAGLFLVAYPKEDVNISDMPQTIQVYLDKTNPENIEEIHYRLKPNVLVKLADKFLGPVPLIEMANGNYFVNLKSTAKQGYVRSIVGDTRAATFESAVLVRDIDALCTAYGREIIFTANPGVEVETQDIASDKELIELFVNELEKENRQESREILNWIRDNAFSKEDKSDDLTFDDLRVARMRAIFNNLELDRRNIINVSRFIDAQLEKAESKDSEFISKVARALTRDEQALVKIKDVKEVKDVIDELKGKEAKLDNKVKKLEKAHKELEESLERKKREELKNQLAEITTLKKAKQEELDSVCESLKLVNSIASLRSEETQLTQKVSAAKKECETYEICAQKASTSLKKAIEENAFDIAFEPALAHKLSQAAALWVKGKEDEEVKDVFEKVSQVKVANLKDKALIDYLVQKVQLCRDYSHNDIVNLFICLTQGFLTVLAGKPGCGKTSICNIVARVLGSTKISEVASVTDSDLANRYLPVSVERGWTSKRDFIGYYNPLSKTFEATDPRRYQCFKILDAEAKTESRLPFVILLDEANLSQMEYYWADFMNICDKRTELSSISIGDSVNYQIPNTLRFLATVNSDQTTEVLSPRLIDRSWVITLPNCDSDFSFDLGEKEVPLSEVEIIGWESLSQTFAVRENSKIDEVTQNLLKAIYKEMASLGYPVSPRTRKAIVGYLSAGQECLEPEIEADSKRVAVDFAVSQKLLPCINLVGDEFKVGLEDLLNLFVINKLNRSATTLKEIISRGDRQHMYMYSFF